MQKFIFFTKTYWSEPPRMRHQFANLLLSYGNEVIFFENPDHVFHSACDMPYVDLPERLQTLRTRDRIHYRLRAIPPFSLLHSFFSMRDIKNKLENVNILNAIIINFNYDYFFLRKLFPKNKIITIINDDFIAQSIFGYKKYVTSSLKSTCQSSNAILTVSEPLLNQLAAWCDPVLFLPWSDSDYMSPNLKSTRNSVLIWASFSNVIDFHLIKKLAIGNKNFCFYLVGPITSFVKRTLSELCNEHKNIVYLPPSDLDSLPLDKFCAGLMPYRAGVPSTEAVTLANKSLRLMSKGLPLIVHGMPHFLKNSAIFSCADANQISNRIEFCSKNFLVLQHSIVELVSMNTPQIRYNKFISILDSIKS